MTSPVVLQNMSIEGFGKLLEAELHDRMMSHANAPLAGKEDEIRRNSIYQTGFYAAMQCCIELAKEFHLYDFPQEHDFDSLHGLAGGIFDRVEGGVFDLLHKLAAAAR